MKNIILSIALIASITSCKEKEFDYQYLDSIRGQSINIEFIRTNDQDKKRLTKKCRQYIDRVNGGATKCVFYMEKDKPVKLDKYKKLPREKRVAPAMNEVRANPHTVAIIVYPGINKAAYEWWQGEEIKKPQKNKANSP